LKEANTSEDSFEVFRSFDDVVEPVILTGSKKRGPKHNV